MTMTNETLDNAMKCPGVPLPAGAFSGCSGGTDCPICKGQKDWLHRLAERVLSAEHVVEESARTYQWFEHDNLFVLDLDGAYQFYVTKYYKDDGSTEEAMRAEERRLRDKKVLRPVDRVLMPGEQP